LASTPRGRTLLGRIARTMAAWNMVGPQDKVLVAVSGGPDSVALLLALHSLGPRWDLALAVAHLDHGLRPESGPQETAFVRGLAEDLGLAFYGGQADVAGHAARQHQGIEAAGRQLRYEYLERTALAHGFGRIALGHTADDNAELILMNLLRGAGPTGLCGIAAVRPPLVIRPLIETRRPLLVEALTAAGTAYLNDPSNADPRFTRNRIRHQVVPLLESRINPSTTEVLNRLGRIMTAENALLEQLAAGELTRSLHTRQPRRIALKVKAVAQCPPALQRRLVRQAIAAVKADLQRIGFVHVQAVLALIHGNAGGALHLPDRILVCRKGSVVTVSRETTPLRSKR